ncbi:type II toxin-antitoxin system VapC family toxin [Ochrobactrum sp. S1502_03]|uniref:type II toxin-antitoxin system VapC family toxin n=1 Tax=Ochrobactrum sp. S1502_03 TaxID=3108451 RepID=UPI0037CCBF89
MSFVLDASIAAAWFLPDEQHEAADRLMTDLQSTIAFVPSLFWFETRNLFLVCERRKRLKSGEALLLMAQLRGFPIEDFGSGSDSAILSLSERYGLSGYDASYLALALSENVPLATGDRKLAGAARAEGILIRGPLENEH